MSPLFAPFSNTIVAPKIVAFKNAFKNENDSFGQDIKSYKLND